MKVTWFIMGLALGCSLFMFSQRWFLPCMNSCKQAFIRTTVEHPAWAKGVWEDIADKYYKEKTK